MTSAAAILALLLAQPAYWLEAPDATRPARLELVAAELAAYPPPVAAALAYQGWRETGWARYVSEGCTEIPHGAPGCDAGRARGYWQVHRGTCPRAWALPAGAPESLHEEAACAARLWTGALQRCRGRHPAGDVAGAFAGFVGGCEWAPAARRAEGYETTLAHLLRLRGPHARPRPAEQPRP